MKIKKLLPCLLALACLMTGCGKTEKIAVDAEKVPVGYTARYHVNAGGTQNEYDQEISVSVKDGFLMVEGLVQTPALGTDGSRLGDQTITTISKLMNGADEYASFGMPVLVEERFDGHYYAADKTDVYTAFTFEHDHKLKMGLLKTSESTASTPKEAIYDVALTEQYFDKDSIAFLLAGFPEGSGKLYLSSGNRQKLQKVCYEDLPEETVTVPAGTFACRVVRIRPNTDFAVTSAKIYLDKTSRVPVKIVQDATVSELRALN